jgi:hypothetical protein
VAVVGEHLGRVGRQGVGNGVHRDIHRIGVLPLYAFHFSPHNREDHAP